MTRSSKVIIDLVKLTVFCLSNIFLFGLNRPLRSRFRFWFVGLPHPAVGIRRVLPLLFEYFYVLFFNFGEVLALLAHILVADLAALHEHPKALFSPTKVTFLLVVWYLELLQSMVFRTVCNLFFILYLVRSLISLK